MGPSNQAYSNKGINAQSNSIISRFKFAAMAGLGKMFGGCRDVYQVFGYDRSVTYIKALGRYRRQDIAARVVEAPANALWTTPPKVTSDNKEWDKIWNDLVVNHNLWKMVNRADRMAGMGDYSVLLIGMDDGLKLNKPADTTKRRKVLYLQPYSCSSATVTKLFEDPTKETYGQPELYNISPNKDAAATGMVKRVVTPTMSVHSSRVLHLAEHLLQDDIFGNSRIERIWNLLDDLLKVCGGTAETFWLTGNRGLQVDVDKDMELTPEDQADLADEIEEYTSQLRRVMRTRGVTVKNLGSDVPDPKSIFEMIMSLLSGATGIPKRILLGSEMGSLASEQDRNNWAERIQERRNEFGEPVVIWPIIRKLTAAGILPKANITIEWPNPYNPSPLEQAQTAAQTARSAVNLAKAMNEKPELVTTAEARKILGIVPETEKANTGDLIENS